MTAQECQDSFDFTLCEGNETLKEEIQNYGIYKYMKFCENQINYLNQKYDRES